MKIVLASRNKHKIEEWQATLRKYMDGVEILSLDEVGILGEIEENGETFYDNALIKASTAAKSGYIGIGDDSGLSVDALGGAPGIYSARYAGEDGNDAKNNEKILRELDGVSDRRARFVCTIACVFPDGDEPITVTGYAEGEMLTEAKGEGGFGYDPLFYSTEGKKTFSEMTAEEKNAVSHRGKAVEKFAAVLAEKYSKIKE